MKLSITLVLAMMASPVKSQYINQIIDNQKEGVFYSTSLLTETHLYYQTQQNTKINLWSMDLSTKKKEKIIDSPYDTEDDEDTEAVDFIKTYRDQVYFSHDNQLRDKVLWSTDGTKTGTRQVNNTELNNSGKFSVYNNELFANNTDDYLVQLKNDVFVTHDVRFPLVEHICVFSENDFVAQSRNAQADTFTLNRVTGSTVSAIYSYSSTYDDDADFEVYKDTCLFTHTANGVRKVMSVPKNGSANLLSEFENISSIKQLINHQGRIYMSAQNIDPTTYSINRLSEDLSEIDLTINISGVFTKVSISSSNQLLTAVVELTGSGGLSAHAFFDNQLREVNSYFNFYQNLNKTAYSTTTEVITVFNDPNDDAIIQTVSSQNNVSLLSIKNHYIGEIISQPSAEAYYLVLYDRKIGAGNIYSLSSQPPLNNSLNGTWHEYDIPNQGLVMQKGKRVDGSDYVFATLYVFDQGQPLWLAGVSELTLDQKVVNIDLFKYDGIQMFEYDTVPTQELFGQISITLENCDTLNLTISSADYNQSLPLYRIDDTSYNHLCPEVKTLNPNSKKYHTLLKEQINE